MSKVEVPLLERYERQKVAIRELEQDLMQARANRDRALSVLDAIGQSRGKYATIAKAAASNIRRGPNA